MSKSLGNYFTLRDLMAKGFTGREVRYLLLTAHYRETFNFTLDGLAGAKTALARIDEIITTLRESAGNAIVDNNLIYTYDYHTEFLNTFTEALNADLNISAALASVHNWIHNHNKNDLLFNRNMAPHFAAQTAAISLEIWQQIDRVLGLGNKSPEEIPAEILTLANSRQKSREAKDWKSADRLRQLIESKGWGIEDSPKGIKIKKL